MKRKILKSVIILLSFIMTSCYGSWNIFYEGNDVDNRTKSMLKITDASDADFAAAGISGLSGQYNVLVVTDLHFGSARDSSPIDNSFFKWLDSVRGTAEYPKFVLCLGDIADVGKHGIILFCVLYSL